MIDSTTSYRSDIRARRHPPSGDVSSLGDLQQALATGGMDSAAPEMVAGIDSPRLLPVPGASAPAVEEERDEDQPDPALPGDD